MIEGKDYYIINLGNAWEGTIGINACAGYGSFGHKSWKRKNNPIGKLLRSIGKDLR